MTATMEDKNIYNSQGKLLKQSESSYSIEDCLQDLENSDKKETKTFSRELGLFDLSSDSKKNIGLTDIEREDGQN